MKLILTSDWHIRSDNPPSRIDDFQEIQKKTLNFIRDIAYEKKAAIIHAGDFFHRAKPINPQYLEILVYNIFQNIDVFFISGQHDLLQHNIDNFEKGSIGVISKFPFFHFLKKKNNIYGFSWEQKIISPNEKKEDNIAVLHKFVSDVSLPPWLEEKGITANDLCEKNSDYNFFICGDNHKFFIFRHSKSGQTIFNPGTITRQKLNEKDYTPCIFFFDTISKKHEVIELPDNQSGVLKKTRKIELQEERESRIDSFVELAGKNIDVSWDYEQNIRDYCEKNNIKKELKNIIFEIIEGCYND